MSMKTLLAAVGTAALTIGLATGGALADAPPAAPKKKAAAPAAAKAAPAEPARAESYERPQIGNWGGLYFGANVGYAWGDLDANFPVQNQTGVQDASVSVNGGILGGHVGIQHQWGRIVVGLEGSYSGSEPFGDLRSRGSCLNGARECEGSVNSIFTVGPRIGLAQDNWLFYATGGWASGLVHTNTYNPASGNRLTDTVARHDGWYIGGGIEWKLHDRWIAGIEYIHVALDTERHEFPPGTFNVSTRDVDGDVDIIRARLSYKFGRDDHAPADAPMK